MAIIYTYPVKSSLASADLILISDSADGNKTKQVAASSLPGFSGSGIVSINGDTTAAQVIGVESGNTFLTVTDSTNTHNIGMTGALPIANGGTALTALGTREQILRVNSGATALEYADLKVSEVVHNNSGASITAGTPIRITGDVTITGVNYLTVSVASAVPSTMPASGLAAADIADGAQGTMVASGMLENIRTNDITGVTAAGDKVYVSSVAGANTIKYLTGEKPTGTNLIQNVGIVTRVGAAGAGSIQVITPGRSNDLPNFGNQGSMWVGRAGGSPQVLPIGSPDRVLTVNAAGTDPEWLALPASVDSISFGTTGLTPNSATTGAVTVAGTLAVASGGTNRTSYTPGDLIYASAPTILTTLPVSSGLAGYVLKINSAGTFPEWAAVSASGGGTVTSVTGTSPISVANNTSTPIVSIGNLPVAKLNSGTGATGFTFWSGTGTAGSWKRTGIWPVVDYTTNTTPETSASSNSFYFSATAASTFTPTAMEIALAAGTFQDLDVAIYAGDFGSGVEMMAQGSNTSTAEGVNVVNLTAVGSASLEITAGTRYVIGIRKTNGNSGSRAYGHLSSGNLPASMAGTINAALSATVPTTAAMTATAFKHTCVIK